MKNLRLPACNLLRFFSKLAKLLCLSLACLLSIGIANAQVATPVFNPQNAQAAVSLSVQVTCATAGTTIRYSTNGADPVSSDPVVSNGDYVIIPRSLTLKAKAWTTTQESAVASATYRIIGDISAGSLHAAAVKSNRFAYAWGHQQYGALGNGVTSSSVPGGTPNPWMTNGNNPVPSFVKISPSLNFGNAVNIAAGAKHTLVLTQNGFVQSLV